MSKERLVTIRPERVSSENVRIAGHRADVLLNAVTAATARLGMTAQEIERHHVQHVSQPTSVQEVPTQDAIRQVWPVAENTQQPAEISILDEAAPTSTENDDYIASLHDQANQLFRDNHGIDPAALAATESFIPDQTAAYIPEGPAPVVPTQEWTVPTNQPDQESVPEISPSTGDIDVARNLVVEAYN